MKVVGLHAPRNGHGNKFFAESKLEKYCEKVIKYEDKDEINSYNPDWVIILCEDEIFSPRMDYMFNSLVLNEHVNVWTSNFLYFWDLEDTYRIDGLWKNQRFPIMYKNIPEIDYKWEEGNLIPSNQPGPIESSSVPVFSYRYLEDLSRFKEWRKFNQNRINFNYITQMYYDSLMDDDIELERWVE